MKPMLSATVTTDLDLTFPCVVSPKLDGIRALILDGKLVSRNLKPIPNRVLRKLLSVDSLDGLDGELISGVPTNKDVFQVTTSDVMSQDRDPERVVFWVFDDCSQLDVPFTQRLESARAKVKKFGSDQVRMVSHQYLTKLGQLKAFEDEWVKAGYEGLMVRAPNGPYKCGRSTMREGWLAKLKRFSDDEAVIIGFEEQMKNNNVATKDALGRTERSHHKENLSGKGTLGSLRVRGVSGEFNGVEFSVGSGFSDETRDRIWRDRKTLLGEVIKYKYFSPGSKNAPRFPTFVWFRKD